MKSYLHYLSIIVSCGLLSGCAGFKPAIHVPPQPPQARAIAKNPDVAVVLGGGGAKGYAHIGVLEVLQKAGVPINLVAGSSAGSVVGALFVDNGRADQAKQALMDAGFWDLADVANFPDLQGPIEGYHFERFLLEHMRSRTFKQTKIPFIVATTDLKQGRGFAIKSGPIAPAVLASAAMPGGVRPQHLYGRILVDGCMVDPVPVKLVKPYHPKVIIAINIDAELPHSMPWSFYGIYKRGFQISWLELTKYTEQGADIIIRPRVGTVGSFDITAKHRMYEAGVKAGQRALPRILALLKRKHIALDKN